MTTAGTITREMRRPRDRQLASAINRVSELVKNAISKVKENKSKFLRKALVLLVAALIVSAAWGSIKDFLQMENITRIVKETGVFGPILLGLIQVIQVIVAVIPGDFLIIVAGKVYGFVGGFWINMVSTLIACFVAFFIARWAGRKVVERMIPAKVLDKWMKVVDEKGSIFFVISFLVPVFPADAMNFVAGLSQITPKKFLLVSIIGRLPKIFLMTLLSSGLKLSPMVWLAIGLALVAGVIVYLIYRNRKKRMVLAQYPNGKELAMNEEKHGLEDEGSQKVEGSEFAAKAAVAVLVLLVTIALILEAQAGNMVLSLVWPVLLLPLLSALKSLCTVLCRFASLSANPAQES
jgi:uncharacterized membrane protein YdjX (TVP38/TMEM64 family)